MKRKLTKEQKQRMSEAAKRSWTTRKTKTEIAPLKASAKTRSLEPENIEEFDNMMKGLALIGLGICKLFNLTPERLEDLKQKHQETVTKEQELERFKRQIDKDKYSYLEDEK